jgi:hypothetical protein
VDTLPNSWPLKWYANRQNPSSKEQYTDFGKADTAIQELGILKKDIEKQLNIPVPKPAGRAKLQTSTRGNIPAPTKESFNPLPMLVIPAQDIDPDSVLLICAYFSHLLRAISSKKSYEADNVSKPRLNPSN